MRHFLLLILLCILAAPMARGSHMAGAELVYSCQGNNLYNIRLTLYRDCTGDAPFDDPIDLYIFNRADNSVFRTIPINVPWSTPLLNPGNWDACLATPYSLCVQVGTYETQVQLPPNNAGYHFAWTRCCRNYSISNLANPRCEGMTFLASVPPTSAAACNSMPVFNNLPSVFLCAGMTYNFDHSATDADGDSLVYSISNPFTGTNLAGFGTGNSQEPACNTALPPTVGPSSPSPGNVMGAPPYANVIFSPGHSFTNPFGPGSYVTINPQTGYLEAFPANLGVYVMAVSVREYRNGILLSENKRDFQFHVIPCQNPGPPPVLSINTGSLPVNGDTILADASQPFCFDFTVTDLLPSYIQVTPISTIFGGNGGFPPPYATINVSSNTPPVSGQVCWQPACSYDGLVIPVVLSARDTNDCNNYNIVFDTVWIRVVAPDPEPPIVQNVYGTLPVNGDTIILDVEENFCYNFYIVDTAGGADLDAAHRITDLQGNLVPQTQTITTWTSGDTLWGEVCWSTACNAGATYMLISRGTDDNQCPPDNYNLDTAYLHILVPDNPEPQLGIDLSGNPLSGDTILAEVKNGFCFVFTVDDTSGIGDSLGFQINLLNTQGGLAPGNPPTYSATGSNTHIDGLICWYPDCENVDSLLMFVVRGQQLNRCQLLTEDVDTIWVRVTEPIKVPPLISHDLGQGPANNTTVLVEDADTFCYTFSLRDTVQPAALVQEVVVYDENGNVYSTAPLPVVTLTTQTPSLLEGQVCWTVPCELSGTQFMIVMTGRDTFDCRIAYWVHDTVFVEHTENLPEDISMCNVSVVFGDEGIDLTWQSPVATPDLAGFVIQRQGPSATVFSPLDTIWNPTANSYTDTGINADNGSHCYQVLAIDRCGRLSLIGDPYCTAFLEANTAEYSSRLEWIQALPYPTGVASQQIHRYYPELPGSPSTMIQVLSNVERSFIDPTITEPVNCYRVAVVAAEGGCGTVSWSNDVCLSFPPTLYVPTAFTPNGDGLNDFFTSFGEFEDGFHMQVWDRWGKLVYESRDRLPGWQGDFKGQPVPEGVYVYRITVTGFDGEVLERHGSITLYR